MRPALLLLTALAAAAPAAAQVENSRPEALVLTDAVPAPRDIPYPGTMTLDVDATDVERGIFRVEQTIPVAGAGPMVLLYPEWLPGNHAPRGPISRLSGLRISGNGQEIEWRRDPLDVYAFHIDIPEGVTTLSLSYQFLSATAANQGRIVMTPEMLNLQWEKMSLYPAGYYVRNIMVTPSVRVPAGWHAATALRPAAEVDSLIRYETVSYDTLVDSPLFAGAHYREERLADDVQLDIFADRASELSATDDQIAAHRSLVEQSVRLFGSRPFDHYNFLLGISDSLGGIGLEHHRSSENAVDNGYFSGWEEGPGSRTLLPHEFTHAWNGKFRRPADLWTPDYRTPMQDSLLWVYEGQTTFWGNILAARSGLTTRQQFLDRLALDAARLDALPARQWRDLQDTTNDPIMAARRPQPWASWQRSEDYYREGSLIWLEIDQIIRRESGGRRSLDDFARSFFGNGGRDWGEVTYDFDDVVAALDAVQPHDWAALLRTRLDEHAAGAPLRGLEMGGYRIVYRGEPTPTHRQLQTRGQEIDLSWSGGFVVENDGTVDSVVWDSPAFDAGLTVGSKIVAINSHAFSTDLLRNTIAIAVDPQNEIELLIRDGERYRTVSLEWRGGLRYPHLERTGSGTAGIDRLLQPLR